MPVAGPLHVLSPIIAAIAMVACSATMPLAAAQADKWFQPEVEAFKSFKDTSICTLHAWQMFALAVFPFVCRGLIDFVFTWILRWLLDQNPWLVVLLSFVPGIIWSVCTSDTATLPRCAMECWPMLLRHEVDDELELRVFCFRSQHHQPTH